jgi:hypothetical protein
VREDWTVLIFVSVLGVQAILDTCEGISVSVLEVQNTNTLLEIPSDLSEVRRDFCQCVGVLQDR